jgi:HAE1 family hydrophobic/amphiphilic exporter-1
MKFALAVLMTFALSGAEFEPAPRIGIVAQKQITLDEAIALALANDKDIDSSRLLREEAGYNVAGARGAFDPRIGLNGNNLKQVSPASSILSGSADGKLTTKQWTLDPFVSGYVAATGATYKLNFSSSRQLSDSTFLSLNPQYPTSLSLNLTQPLMRGLRYDDNRHRFQVAKKNQSLSDEQFRQKVIDVVTQTEAAYWDLDYAVRDYQAQLDAVRLAGQQKESNTRQMNQGVLAPIDVVAAETQVATFEQQFYQSQQTLTRAENALKQLMAGGRTDVLWSTGLTPVTKVDTEYAAGVLEEEIAAALKKRPEMAQARIASEVNELDAKLYKDQTKPQVDFVGQFSMSGLAGPLVSAGPNPISASFGPLINELNALAALAGQPPVSLSSGSSAPGLLVGGYGKSLSNLGSGIYPTVQVGVQMSLPIRNRTANANLAVAAAEGKRLKNQQSAVEMAVVADVRNSAQGLAAAEARFRAASRARSSAEEQYASEQRQFKAGTSTLFLVLQRQTEMIAAVSRELRARSDVGKAIADLERATGEALEKRKVELK